MVGFLSTGVRRAAGCDGAGAGRVPECSLATERGLDNAGLAEAPECVPGPAAERDAVAILLVVPPCSSSVKKPIRFCSSWA
ncbi:hypothetical protein BN874_1750002 [Candidatus Contendobacter odensis Run_B_J11]|uniref:Uncharacterized protein n=1 Tax=Candidatus Contendobacter odensis Run_B_J11 TaxID=1400861 RepID=A0A7U7J3P6_9GAMM|nr:hypothetical protein BN874_1750002 [Candidatus Contendobacter odensis Run_B_J11]